jgi:protein-tyrosine phosphatase
VIDLHCHILPGLDDGALDLADAVGMARQAAADAITAVCATPHIRSDHDVRIRELAERLGTLTGAVGAAGLAVELLGGGEVAQPVADSLTDEELRLVSLGGGRRWILLEPASGPLSDGLAATVDALAARDFSCVIAHPERHLAADLPERLGKLARAGALVQVTAADVESGPAADALLGLVADGLAHVIASDAHSSHRGRAVRLSGAFARMRAAGVPEARVRWMAVDVPRAIVRGELIPS